MLYGLDDGMLVRSFGLTTLVAIGVCCRRLMSGVGTGTGSGTGTETSVHYFRWMCVGG